MADPNTQTSTPTQNLSATQAIRLLASFKSLNLATAGDNTAPIIAATTYSVKDIVITKCSAAATTAALAILTAPASAGTAVLSATTLTNLTASTVVMDYPPTTTAALTAQNLYLRVTTAFGSACTADVYIYGYELDLDQW